MMKLAHADRVRPALARPGHHVKSFSHFRNVLAVCRAVLLASSCAACAGCYGWRQVSTTDPLGAGIRGHAMAYDPVQKQVMAYGGIGAAAGSEMGETWEWNGAAWTQLSPANSPGPLFKAAMACDTSRNRVVLFGGVNGTNESHDTYEWDGSNWTKMTPSVSPPARHHHAMAYDAKRKVVVLFGGYTSSDPGNSNQPNDLADTWEWDGATWTQMHPAVSPPKRDGFAMAYDAKNGCVVLFGGAQDVGCFHNYPDTWTWDGTNWTQAATGADPTQPAARGSAALAYDEGIQQVVLFSGFASGPTIYFDDTYAWDGSSWKPLHQSPLFPNLPVGRFDHAMAYDSSRGIMLMFAGFNGNNSPQLLSDTWKH